MMTDMNNAKVLNLSLLFCGGLAAFAIMYQSDLQLTAAEKSTKEYFFDKQAKVDNNPLLKLFSFADSQLALASFSSENIVFPVEFKKQENRLTCEIAALRTSLNQLGINVSENDLLGKLEYSTMGPANASNVWGDPQKGFVGNINGSVFLGTGYGVHNEPIARLASNYRTAEARNDLTITDVLSNASQGRAVIVWGLLRSKHSITWTSYEGKEVTAYPGEHARVVMGYSGDINNPDNIILMDPLYGKVSVSTDDFQKDWDTVGNMAVIVY